MRVCRIRKKSEAGLTLVEMIVALLIVSFLGGALYVTFSQGLKAWQMVKRGLPGEQSGFFIEKMTSEIRNAFVYRKESILGDKKQFYFYAPVLRKGKGELENGVRVPARIRYYFDASKKAVCQDTDFYEKILTQARPVSKCASSLENVTNAGFEYYRPPTDKVSGGWVSSWEGACFPNAVKIVWESSVEPGNKSVRIIRLPGEKFCQN